MIEYNKKLDDTLILPSFKQTQSDPARGKVHFCHNLVVYLVEKGKSPCKQEFPEKKKKKDISIITISKVYIISHHITIYLQLKSYHQNQTTLHIKYK